MAAAAARPGERGCLRGPERGGVSSPPWGGSDPGGDVARGLPCDAGAVTVLRRRRLWGRGSDTAQAGSGDRALAGGGGEAPGAQHLFRLGQPFDPVLAPWS